MPSSSFGHGGARNLVGGQGAKVVAKHVSRSAAKTVARTATNPLFIVAECAGKGTELVARELGFGEDESRRAGKTVGFAAHVGTGAAIGGPIGAATGAAVWLVGEAFSALWGD